MSTLKDIFMILNRIEGQLGQMHGKQDEICRNTAKLSKHIDKVENEVTCQAKDFNNKLGSKVSLKIFIAIMGTVTLFISGAYTYAYNVNKELHNHEVKAVHYYRIVPEDLDPN